MKIMLSTANSPVAPSIIKHLKLLGHTVIGHDCNELGIGARRCDKFLKSPRVGTAAFMTWVLTQDFDLYIPFLDEELANIGELSKLRRVACSPVPTLEIFTSKVKQQAAMEAAGLPIAPRTKRVPGILKPDHGRGGKGIIRIDDQDVADYYIPISNGVFQKFIKGDEYTVDVLVDRKRGEIGIVSRLRIVASNVSLVGKVVKDQECFELAQRVVSSFDFEGPINIQMIRERDTGRLYIIEVNPRLSGSCMFTVRAGFDILNLTVRLFTGGDWTWGVAREATFCRHYEETEL